MNKNDLHLYMTFKDVGKIIHPMEVFEVNGSYIIAVYQGRFSKYDILIKYRQKDGDSWSRIRTPKHIHWAVDILIKLNQDGKKTQQFLDFLITVWDNTRPVKSQRERQKRLNLSSLLEESKDEINKFHSLGTKGEYSIKFLILLAKLLMIQEKTNRKDAYMFKNCLKALKEGNDIFSVISIASHVGR